MSDHTRRSALSALGAAVTVTVAGCFGTSGDAGTATSTESNPTGAGSAATGSEPTPTASESTAAGSAAPDPLRWRTEFDHRIAHEPTVTDDAVYLVSHAERNDVTPGGREPKPESGTVASVDPVDGSLRWQASVGPPPIDRPAVRGGNAYLVVGYNTGYAGQDYQLVAVDDAGTERWRALSVGTDVLSLVAVDDRRVYVGTSDDTVDDRGEQLYGLDAATGTTEWTVDSGDVRGGARHDDLLFVDSSPGVSVRTAADGAERWHRSGWPFPTPSGDLATSDGMVFHRFYEGPALAALDPADGSVVWRYDASRPAGHVAVGPRGDTVFGNQEDGMIFALDVADGAERWTLPTDEGCCQQGRHSDRYLAAVVDGTVVVDSDQTLYGFDVADGTELWRRSIDGPASAKPTADGVVFLPENDGDPYRAVDADGNLQWSYTPDGTVTATTITDDGVLLGTQEGTLLSVGAR